MKNIFILMLLLGSVFLSSCGVVGQFSTISTDDTCSSEPLILDGVHIQTYDDFRAVFNVDYSDEEIESSGIEKRFTGLYIEECVGVYDAK